MSRESASDFAAGFIMGAFVGAALALLFTPVSGEEMRTQIREKGIELKERAEDLSVEASRQAEAMRSKGQTLLVEQKTRFQEAIEEGKQAAARKKEELLSQIEQARSSGGAVNLSEQKS